VADQKILKGGMYQSIVLSQMHTTNYMPFMPVGGVAQWLRRWSLAGGLSLIYA